MLATSAPFATMLAGREQTVAVDVSIDLPGGIYPSLALALTQWEVDASIDSDMPQGTRLEEGFSAVAGSFTVAGRVDPTDETKTAAWLFARYPIPAADGSISPLYHTDVLMADVTMSIGLYPAGSAGVPEVLEKLVGKVEDYTRDPDGNVVFTVIDLRQSFRSTVDVPAIVTPAPINAGLTSEFAVDRLLRSASSSAISSWPALRAGCLLAAGFRTSPWPEVGSFDPIYGVGSWSFAPGIWGSAITDVDPMLEGLNYLLDGTAANDVYTEFAFTADGTLNSFDLGVVIGEINVTDSVDLSVTGGGQLRARVWSATGTNASFTFPPTVTAGTHTVALQVHWLTGSTSWSATLTYDGINYVTGTQTIATARSFIASVERMAAAKWANLSSSVTVEAWQVTGEAPGAVTSWNTFTPRAVLDPSLNTLVAIPEITGDPWQGIQQIAQAELAVAGFEGDIFRYLNRQTLRATSSVRDITSDQALNALQEQSTSASVVNRAQVGWTGWTFATTNTTLWTAVNSIRVPARGTWTSTVTLDGLATSLDTSPTVLADGSTNTTSSHYRASVDQAGTAEFTGILTFTITQPAPNQITISVANASNKDAWFVTPANYLDLPVGTPLLRIAGIAVTAADEQVVDFQYPPATVTGTNGLTGAAGSRFGEILYQLTGNPWIQDEDSAQQLAQDIVIDSYLPRADLLNVDIAPDPRLQRCDRVHPVDTARTGVDEYALIFGYTITYQASGDPATPPQFSMTVDARTVGMPGGWLGGVTGRSTGGVSTYGY